MKEGYIQNCSERTCAHYNPVAGSTATSFSGCVSVLMTRNHHSLRMTSTETVLQKRNLFSFRKIPTLHYVGLDLHFGVDSRYFDKIEASRRKWGRIIEDVVKVSMPAYEPMENGLTHFYVSVPKQSNRSVELPPINNLTSNSLDLDT
ncbi:hypothetical protein AHAS_Ahas19G0233500 [Arachis hypogaea]